MTVFSVMSSRMGRRSSIVMKKKDKPIADYILDLLSSTFDCFFLVKNTFG